MTARSTTRPARAAFERRRLHNGLRVVLDHRPGAATVAVSVHYGVGHRNERPGQAGLAHLFEHLMTQDAHGPVTSRKLLRAHELGGSAGATTHQDYTDYFQVVPAAAAETVLHWEADRMRAPRFSPAHLATQLAGVADEVSAAVDQRPYGGIPWPALPAVLFRTFANSHDGYGELSTLRSVTHEECLAFFATHYAPANAVLTVSGDLGGPPGGPALEALVERHFGTVEARRAPRQPDLHEPALDEDRVARRHVPGRGPALAAVGYRLPDPTVDLDSYLACVLLAELLAGQGSGQPAGSRDGPAVMAASCGFFDPLDARDPDALVVLAGPLPDHDPQAATAAVEDRLRLVACGIGDEALGAARGRASVAARRRFADPLARCRDAGRFELLHGRPGLGADLPAALAGVTEHDVRAAAHRLLAAHRAVLTAVPAGARPRSWPLLERSAEPAPAGPGFRPLPVRAATAPPGWEAVCSRTLDGGHEVVAVAHPGADVVEARVRLSLRDPDPHVAARLASALDRALSPRLPALHVSSAAGAVTLGCPLEPVNLPGWLEVVGRLLRDVLAGRVRVIAPADPGRDTAGGGRVDASQLADSLCQLRHLGIPPEVPPAGPSLAPQPGLRAGLVVVGALDPGSAVEQAAAVLDPLGEGWDAAVPCAGSAPAPPATLGSELLAVEAAARRPALVMRAAQPGGDTEAARYLLVAVLCGVGDLRRPGGARLGTIAGSGLAIARDVVAGRVSVVLSAEPPAGGMPDALLRLHREVFTRPPSSLARSELARVQEFCAGQWAAQFDDAATLADTVLQQLGYGQVPDALPAFADEIGATTLEEVRTAWHRVQDAAFTGVVVARGARRLAAASPWPVVTDA